jgi:hypothetical protein
MKTRSHLESYIFELEDGTQLRIFPGDIDVTLGWVPETELTPLTADHEIGSHVLVSETGPVPVGESWAEREVKSTRKDG